MYCVPALFVVIDTVQKNLAEVSYHSVLISSSPIYDFFGRLSAADTGLAQRFLLERNTTGSCGKIFFDFVFTLLTATISATVLQRHLISNIQIKTTH